VRTCLCPRCRERDLEIKELRSDLSHLTLGGTEEQPVRKGDTRLSSSPFADDNGLIAGGMTQSMDEDDLPPSQCPSLSFQDDELSSLQTSSPFSLCHDEGATHISPWQALLPKKKQDFKTLQAEEDRWYVSCNGGDSFLTQVSETNSVSSPRLVSGHDVLLLEIDDIVTAEDGQHQIMSDGCAFVSYAVMIELYGSLEQAFIDDTKESAGYMATNHLRDARVPACFQGRIGPYKGVWVCAPKDMTEAVFVQHFGFVHNSPFEKRVPSSTNLRWISVRGSMKKINLPLHAASMQQRMIEVVRFSKCSARYGTVNRQMLSLLIAYPKDREPEKDEIQCKAGHFSYNNQLLQTLVALQNDELHRWSRLLNSPGEMSDILFPELSHHSQNPFQFDGQIGGTDRQWSDLGLLQKLFYLSQAGLWNESEMQYSLFALYQKKMDDYVSKPKIQVPLSRNLIIIPDPTGEIPEGHCFLHLSGDSAVQMWRDYCKQESIESATKVWTRGSLVNSWIFTGDVIVTRNPCYHPGDIVKLKAVDIRPQSSWREVLVDVCVISIRGKISDATKMMCGDFDGDIAFVCFDPKITAKVQPRTPTPWYKYSRCVQSDEKSDCCSHLATLGNSSSANAIFGSVFSTEVLIEFTFHIEDKLELCVYCDNLLWAQNIFGSYHDECIRLSLLCFQATRAQKHKKDSEACVINTSSCRCAQLYEERQKRLAKVMSKIKSASCRKRFNKFDDDSPFGILQISAKQTASSLLHQAISSPNVALTPQRNNVFSALFEKFQAQCPRELFNVLFDNAKGIVTSYWGQRRSLHLRADWHDRKDSPMEQYYTTPVHTHNKERVEALSHREIFLQTVLQSQQNFESCCDQTKSLPLTIGYDNDGDPVQTQWSCFHANALLLYEVAWRDADEKRHLRVEYVWQFCGWELCKLAWDAKPLFPPDYVQHYY
jgi:hypothetical protein